MPGPDEAHHEVVAARLEARHDGADEAALDAVRLDHDVGALLVGVSHGYGGGGRGGGGFGTGNEDG